MEAEVSFEEIFLIIKKRSKIIIGWSLLGIIISSLYTFYIVTPTFESSSRIVVNQTQNTNQTITNMDIQTNLSLINTYKSIIREPIILENAIDRADSDLSIEELRRKIDVQTQDNSLVFGINVRDESPYVAAELANSIASSFESKIGDILEVESVTILSQATPNLDAVSPNTIINIIMGGIVGLIIGSSIAFLSEFMDKRVKDTKIIEDLGWTNLGSILEMSANEVKETRIDKKVRTKDFSPSLSRRRV